MSRQWLLTDRATRQVHGPFDDDDLRLGFTDTMLARYHVAQACDDCGVEFAMLDGSPYEDFCSSCAGRNARDDAMLDEAGL